MIICQIQAHLSDFLVNDWKILVTIRTAHMHNALNSGMNRINSGFDSVSHLAVKSMYGVDIAFWRNFEFGKKINFFYYVAAYFLGSEL